MDPVVHFEMPYDDPGRMSRLYEAIFGWRTNALGADMGNYILATTTESEQTGPKRPGAGPTVSSSSLCSFVQECAYTGRSVSFLASSAQAMRAFLLAMATSVR